MTSVSQPFFSQWASGLATGTYPASSATYATVTRGMRTQAQGFVSIVNSHAQTNSSLNEEFDRNTGQYRLLQICARGKDADGRLFALTGYSIGARDLTWSYASWLSNSQAAAGTPVF